MSRVRYQIFQLSARAVMNYAMETADSCAFDLSASATEKCESRIPLHCPMLEYVPYYQAA